MSSATPILERGFTRDEDDPSIIYPDSDGLPMSDNTEQFEWISRIKWGIQHLYADDPNVFVAGDLLWYPVKGKPRVRAAPDTMVVFGRPMGYRGSYVQWREDNVPPQVVFEIKSPGNTKPEMQKKWDFYNRYGVEEYYFYDPESNRLDGWIRREADLEPIDFEDGWVSPRLGIGFELTYETFELIAPNGEPFAPTDDVYLERDEEKQRRIEAERRLVQLQQETDQQQSTIEMMREQLRNAGIDPDSIGSD